MQEQSKRKGLKSPQHVAAHKAHALRVHAKQDADAAAAAEKAAAAGGGDDDDHDASSYAGDSLAPDSPSARGGGSGYGGGDSVWEDEQDGVYGEGFSVPDGFLSPFLSPMPPLTWEHAMHSRPALQPKPKPVPGDSPLCLGLTLQPSPSPLCEPAPLMPTSGPTHIDDRASAAVAADDELVVQVREVV